MIHTTASERKVLLACGAAAGMSATFNTPIPGVILAIELLLFEFKSRSFIPLVIASSLATDLSLKILLVVMIAKAIALVVSLGSGTSGGLLAPMFMSGAAMGGAFAIGIDKIFPWVHLSPGAFALVAMGAVFGAASRATFAFIIFAFEITRDYNSVLPLMLVSVIAAAIAILLMPRASIMTEKLARRGLRIHQDYEMDVMQQVRISETMDPDLPSVSADLTISKLAELIARHDSEINRHQGLLIKDAQGKLVGMVTRGDGLRSLDQDPSGNNDGA